MDKDDKCSVCGQFKLPHQDYCTECERQKATVEKLKRQRKRDAAFGSPWDVTKKGPRYGL